MHRVEKMAVKKSDPCLKKKSKIVYNFFVTKVTDLKTTFLKSP